MLDNVIFELGLMFGCGRPHLFLDFQMGLNLHKLAQEGRRDSIFSLKNRYWLLVYIQLVNKHII